jgi:hypothetical protein
MEEWSKDLEGADGTKTPKATWIEPDDGILPPPLLKEGWAKVKNDSEENREKLRQLLRSKKK